VGELQDAVGKRRLPVIDVRDDSSEAVYRGCCTGSRSAKKPAANRWRHPEACDTIARFVRTPLRRAPPKHPEGIENVANIKSQKKRILTNEKARLRNKAVKSALKTVVRRVDEAVAAGDKTAAVEAAEKASRALDKAASKGIIHKNQAANRKSGVMNKVSSLEG